MTNGGDPWTVYEDNGWRVRWKGREWPGVHPTNRAAGAYVKRLRQRYPGSTPATILGEPDEEENGRQRGGPWKWTTPEDATTAEEHGTNGVIHTSRLQDAKSILRKRMDRKRLPNGTSWECVG